ncbi:MAG: hypothetical protein ABJA71_12020, partial [Ginsengibacter sp.]
MAIIEAAILYTGDKILAQIIKDEIWIKRLGYFFFPPKTYKTRLIDIIDETIEEYEKNHPYSFQKDKKRFYEHKIIFDKLSTFILFQENTLDILETDFQQYPEVITPKQEEIEEFYSLFTTKFYNDPILNTKYIDENYKEQIYKLSPLLGAIKEVADAIKEDTKHLIEVVEKMDTLDLSSDWFKAKLAESIKNLDKRYTPELNYDLPIAKIFEGLARDSYFKTQFESYHDSFLRNYKKAISHTKEVKVKEFVEKITSATQIFKENYNQIDFAKVSYINRESLCQILEDLSDIVDELIIQFYTLDHENKKEKKNIDKYSSDTNQYGWDIDYFRKFRSSINEFNHFLYGPTVSLSNQPFLLLTGDAGIGKSHLLADISEKRLERNQFTILLLGQHFTSQEPWSQIKELLKLNCGIDKFLEILNLKGETCGSRILFFIDAINEGEGKKIWKNHIKGFISTISKYPNLGVVFSVRSSYENLLIPKSLVKGNEVIRVTHTGFASQEYEASKLFFDNYGIKQPSIPLLHPEFSNPLFLKLFCKGLFNKGLHEIPNGYEGISNIISTYLESINLSISEKYDLPIAINIVQKIAKKLAGKIADSNNTNIKLDDAFSFITELPEIKIVINKSQFFLDLISEGLLTQNSYWDNEGNDYESIYFSYERFSDHLVASYLIEKYLNTNNPKESFGRGTYLFEIIKDQNQTYNNKGVVDALAIQLPEIIGLELFEVAEHARAFRPIASAFIESIIWRKKETMRGELKDYINEVVTHEQNLHDNFINTILLVTSQPGHYFNSDFLHSKLMRFSMADRDEWWSIFIHNQYRGYEDEVSPIRRIIDWGWTEDRREYISEESIRLMCQTLFWCCTSMNRTLRDSATKALICLLEERINVLIELINIFKEVNDPYVSQRVYAVAYGCALRTSKIELLKDLSNCIYETVFNRENVVPDILLRDYAREIIEFSVVMGHRFEFSLDKIRPPFKSELPEMFPSNAEIAKFKLDYEAKSFKKYHWSQNAILDSMVTEYGRGIASYGDFGRYTFESALKNWKEVDTNGLSNLAVTWIFGKYGYNVEKHGEFDSTIGSGRGRNSPMEERIGKKYQWISLHEIAARVSDNYNYYNDVYGEDTDPNKYEGPWEPYIRDIDPSIIMKEILENKFQNYWWNPVSYSNWEISNKDWIHKTDNLPNPIDLVNVVDQDGKEWLVLEIHCAWTEPADIGEDKWENPHKDLWYQIRSYLTKKDDHNTIIEWAKGKSFMNARMPEPSRRYEMFSREFYWSPASKTFRREYDGGSDWSEIYDPKTRKYVGEIALTSLD